MTSFFPDLNVWIALSVAGHSHSAEAWDWLGLLPGKARLVFSRYTQVGLLRLLTNVSAMGEQTLTLNSAWGVYDRWLSDPRGLDAAFREATAPFAAEKASKQIGDCCLLASAKGSGAVLVTFDRSLLKAARKVGCAAILPR